MKTIGVSKVGLNSAVFYQNLLNKLDFSEFMHVENVNFEKSYDYILFDGGADVSPRYYNEQNICSYIDEFRDEYEIAIFNKYKNTPTKFAGICRGHQLLNVLYGGTLYQNLSDYFLAHKSYHTITINQNANSILKDILPSITEVNSLHHQAVKKLAYNLYPIAFETITGVVEIYGEEHDKVRAVQFHPEFYQAFPYTKEILEWLFGFFTK